MSDLAERLEGTSESAASLGGSCVEGKDVDEGEMLKSEGVRDVGGRSMEELAVEVLRAVRAASLESGKATQKAGKKAGKRKRDGEMEEMEEDDEKESQSEEAGDGE
jgi:hypothetical protein